MDKKLDVLEVNLIPVTNGDIGTLNFVINCIRQVASVAALVYERYKNMCMDDDNRFSSRCFIITKEYGEWLHQARFIACDVSR